MTSDGPAVIVAFEGREIVDVSACSAMGVVGPSYQPVTEISMTGEQPRHGAVAVKFGSLISWWPLGSPKPVVGAGMGRSPSSVEAMDVPNPWDSVPGGYDAVCAGGIGPTVRDGMRLMLDADGIGPRVLVADGIRLDGAVLEAIGADGINPDGTGSGSIGAGVDGISPEDTGSEVIGAAGIGSVGGACDGIKPKPRDSDGISLEGAGSGRIDADGMRPVTTGARVSARYFETNAGWCILGNKSKDAVDGAIDASLSIAKT